jgi:predicted DNA-binding protein YlxM (UPF0122 family)
MEAMEMVLLFDYYGNLLTDRQKECLELRYNQDLSLGEIGQILGISRQGVHDNLNRAEQLLRNMEEKTGCVKRDMACRRAVRTILEAARNLQNHEDDKVSALVAQIVAAAQGIEE